MNKSNDIKKKIAKNVDRNIKETTLLFQPWKWDKEIRREVFKLVILIYISMYAAVALFCECQDATLGEYQNKTTIMTYINPFSQRCIDKECFRNPEVCNQQGKIVPDKLEQYEKETTEGVNWDKLNLSG